MSIGQDSLKNLHLENLKMHAQTRHAVTMLKLHIEMLEAVLKREDGLSDEAKAAMARMGGRTDAAIAEMDERFNALLTAMERYSNG